MNWVPFVEILLGVYFTYMAAYAAENAIFGTLPFIFIFQFGFLYTGLLSLSQNLGKLGVVREQEA